MVFFYIIYFIRNRNKILKGSGSIIFNFKFLRKLKYMFPFLLLSVASPNLLLNTSENILFIVSRNHDSIGYVDIEKKTTHNIVNYTVDSEINVNVIFNFTAKGYEKSVFKEDVLVYSSMYRKLNNRLKLNQFITLENGIYIFNNKGKKENLKINQIKNNLVTLLYNEPLDIHEVYSDKYKKMVQINSLGNGKYKIVLPNKSTSIYHYKNGQCMKVELIGSFYKVDLIRN